MNKLITLFNTVKYLKSIQIFFRIFYFIRKRFRELIGFEYNFSRESNSAPLQLDKSIDSYQSYKEGEFTFLNKSKKFEDINWNYDENGKLWTYNLTYFEFLLQKGFDQNDGKNLIYDFLSKQKDLKDALEPFPISLRSINWIKFLTSHQIRDKRIDTSLYSQYFILLDNLEYHLLGNHLLENGFSLLFGGYYFQDERLYEQGKKILLKELDEQILADGGHFELSPMYHQIMLFRVLDCINLVKNNSYRNGELLGFLKDKAGLMLSWLKTVTYKNGDIPLLNDSANKIAPTTQQLLDYAKLLNVEFLMLNVELKDSGYRKIVKEKYECIVDVGSVGPDYIPGHAHADTFNFEVYKDEKPFIVDVGLSTYETNELRHTQRSTKSHNTVEIKDKNSSEVWGAFRVGKRANILKTIESDESIESTHNGYENVLHTRKWIFGDRKIIVKDSLNKNSNALARIHFYPSTKKCEIENSISIKGKSYNITNYQYAMEFNKEAQGYVVEIAFEKELEVEINI